ncbi:hypothetical protein GCM10007304_18120 [Rhodococcoides trifolii]|uniref:Uncharacterized protein n=1 Tax=Rhodococcoides trifolii TaxID=908250 RepID=A0A917CZL6_9NOCA|nr:hypothetical protein [Rhodococcus trifolii]GGG04398.1 hypothetical protein GCM10007304_18120 [Rhodococcus trifolii]
MTTADELAAESLSLARQALASVERLHPDDGTRILVTAAAATAIAILAAQAELREQTPKASTVHYHSANGGHGGNGGPGYGGGGGGGGGGGLPPFKPQHPRY